MSDRTPEKKESQIPVILAVALAIAFAYVVLDFIVNAIYDALDKAGFFKWLFSTMGWL